MLNFVYLRSSRLHFLHFLAWFMHCQQGGEVWACFGLLNAFRRFSGGFEPFLGSVVHRSDRLWSPVWPVKSVGPVHMLLSGLTGGVDRSDTSEPRWCSCSVFVKWCACIRPGGVPLFQGELACVQGELFVVFELWFGGLRSLLEHSFVSDVSSRCPFLRGPRLVFFKWSFSLPFFGFRSLVGVSFYSFLFVFFSLGLLYLCVVNALIKGEIENHVWFEDWWMVASWCDEWLTTLCRLILGSILLVQVAAWLVLVQVKNKRERSLQVRPPGVEKTSRLRLSDPVASGVKCGPHGGKNGKMKSWTVSWLSLKTKVEPGLRGSRVMSGD
jgi:hypothetical protein